MLEEPAAIEIADFPQMDTGAPCPLVLADGFRVVLCYFLRSEGCGVISFENAISHSLGGPSEETLHGHPLWSRGLKHYGVFTIEHSPLIDRLEAIDSVHPNHKPGFDKRFKHYIIPFHDETFECVSRSCVITRSPAEINSERLASMIEALNAKRTAPDDWTTLFSKAKPNV
jgi:hypothetical protein